MGCRVSCDKPLPSADGMVAHPEKKLLPSPSSSINRIMISIHPSRGVISVRFHLEDCDFWAAQPSLIAVGKETEREETLGKRVATNEHQPRRLTLSKCCEHACWLGLEGHDYYLAISSSLSHRCLTPGGGGPSHDHALVDAIRDE